MPDPLPPELNSHLRRAADALSAALDSYPNGPPDRVGGPLRTALQYVRAAVAAARAGDRAAVLEAVRSARTAAMEAGTAELVGATDAFDAGCSTGGDDYYALLDSDRAVLALGHAQLQLERDLRPL